MKNNFEILLLGDLCEFKYGDSLPERKRIPGNVPVYGSNGIVGNHNQSVTQGETIIVGRKGSIGEVHYSGGQCFPIDTTYYISETKRECSFRWLYYILRSLRLTELNKSSAVPGLNRNDAYEKKIIFPPLPIQKQIAAILEKTDAACEKRRQANKLTEQFLQSAFLEMFGDPVTNPKGWRVANVYEIASNIQYGYTESATMEKVGPKFLRITDIQNGMVNWDSVPYCKCPDLDKYKLEDGDIVFARTGATTGKSLLIKHSPTAVFASYLIRVQLKKDVSPAYIYHFFQTESYWTQIRMGMTGSTQGGFNSSKLAEVKFPLPPLIEQQKFAILVEKVESLPASDGSMRQAGLRAKQRESEKELENLFNALMQKAFKGELVQ
jgi:type I restriction enzyme S subunit